MSNRCKDCDGEINAGDSHFLYAECVDALKAQLAKTRQEAFEECKRIALDHQEAVITTNRGLNIKECLEINITCGKIAEAIEDAMTKGEGR